MKALFDALNVAYDEVEKRGFIRLLLMSMTFTFGRYRLLHSSRQRHGRRAAGVELSRSRTARRILVSALPALVLLGVALSRASRCSTAIGPSRNLAQWRWITPGSVVAALVWLTASVLFSWYLANFANYTATYGSLGAVIGVMTWLYISIWIVLAGAELNAEIEHQTARDTTVGPEKPLGARGAAMADKVGEARA